MTGHHHRHHRHHHHPSSGLRVHFGIELLGGRTRGLLGVLVLVAYSEYSYSWPTTSIDSESEHRLRCVSYAGTSPSRSGYFDALCHTFRRSNGGRITRRSCADPEPGKGSRSPHLFHPSVKNLLCQLGRIRPPPGTGRLPTVQECLVTKLPSLLRLTSHLRS